MPRSRSSYGWTLLVPALLVGCGSPPSESVAIDLERLLKAEKVATAPSPPLPTPPKPAAAIVQQVAARPGQALRDPSHASPGTIRASIERQQQEALATLERRLRDYYRLQADAFELEQGRTVDKEAVTDYAEANAKIRLAFEAYGDARAPKVTRLAVLVGFPDPNPNSIPPKIPMRPVSQARFDEAKRLRGELAALDAKFNAEAQEILAAVVSETAAEREAMRLKVEAFRKDLNHRAEQEAQAEVRTSVKELGLQLTEPSPVLVPGTPTRRVEIPAETPLPPAPKVPSVGIPSGLADRRRLLQHELTIWLGLNRYHLAKGGRDATEDFQRWRETYRAGL